MNGNLPRIVVDLEKLRHMNCGLGRFSLHLAEGLLDLAPDRFQPVFLIPPGAVRLFPAGDFTCVTAVPWKKEFVQQLIRPLALPFLPQPDIALWHVTHQSSKYLPLDPRVPVLLTIHDLNFLHEPPHDEHVGKIARKLAHVQAMIDRAAAVVCDSQFVADDVARHLQLGDRSIHVVPLGISPPPPAAPERPAWLPPGRFLLTVGNCLAHKNFHVLLDLVEQLEDRSLVIAGKKTTAYGEFLRREIARRGLEGKAIMPGEVSDGERQWLYEQCEAFVFPSLTEGFGFPVLEAMQAGRPVFMARVTCLPEVAGDYGFYLESFDPRAMAATYVAGLDAFRADPDFGPRSRAHAATFSWQDTARGYVRVYESIIRQTARRSQ